MPALGITVLACVSMGSGDPARAYVSIDTFAGDQVFDRGASGLVFTAHGITATVLNPTRGGLDAVSRSVPVGMISLPGAGTCLGGSRPAAVVSVCGNAAGPPAPHLDLIQILFNQTVRLDWISGYARANLRDNTAINSVHSTWSNGLGASRSLVYTVDTATAPASFGLFRQMAFHSPMGGLEARAGVPITVASSFSNSLDYWLTSIGVTPVPGPLPILGAGAAWGWSQRLRRRIAGRRRDP